MGYEIIGIIVVIFGFLMLLGAIDVVRENIEYNSDKARAERWREWLSKTPDRPTAAVDWQAFEREVERKIRYGHGDVNVKHLMEQSKPKAPAEKILPKPDCDHEHIETFWNHGEVKVCVKCGDRWRV